MEKKCIIEGAKVFSGQAGTRLQHLDLLLDGGLIADVAQPGSFSTLTEPALHINAEGRTVLPGLIDCHVHLFLDATPNPTDTYMAESSEITLIRAVKNCRQHLEAGVTTVRDLGAYRREIFPLLPRRQWRANSTDADSFCMSAKA